MQLLVSHHGRVPRGSRPCALEVQRPGFCRAAGTSRSLRRPAASEGTHIGPRRRHAAAASCRLQHGLRPRAGSAGPGARSPRWWPATSPLGRFGTPRVAPRRAYYRPKFATRRMQPPALGSRRPGGLPRCLGRLPRRDRSQSRPRDDRPRWGTHAGGASRGLARRAPKSSRFAPAKCADSAPCVSDRTSEVARAASRRGMQARVHVLACCVPTVQPENICRAVGALQPVLASRRRARCC